MNGRSSKEDIIQRFLGISARKEDSKFSSRDNNKDTRRRNDIADVAMDEGCMTAAVRRPKGRVRNYEFRARRNGRT